MVRIADVTSFLREVAPLSLAEDWDNVGLLIGDETREISAVMTCLTLSPDLATEAVRKQAQLVVSHHPVLFRPVQQLTTQTPQGRMLLRLIEAGIAVYSPHTGYDSARDGINRQLAERLGLRNIGILRPRPEQPEPHTPQSEETPLGAGRYGDLPSPVALREFLEFVKARLEIGSLQYVGDPETVIERVGVACGSAAEFLHDALRIDCQLLLTGEARFHACLEAGALDMVLLLIGHYASERPSLERLAEVLGRQFPDLTVWASQEESDPLKWS